MKSKLPATFTLAQVTMLTGVSRQAIAKHGAEGIITRVEPGAYDSRSIARYCSHLRELASGNTTPERAELTRERVLKARFEREKMAGQWAPTAEIERVWSAYLASLKPRLLSVPPKVGARWGLVRNAVEAQPLVKREIEAVMIATSSATMEAGGNGG